RIEPDPFEVRVEALDSAEEGRPRHRGFRAHTRVYEKSDLAFAIRREDVRRVGWNRLSLLNELRHSSWLERHGVPRFGNPEGLCILGGAKWIPTKVHCLVLAALKLPRFRVHVDEGQVRVASNRKVKAGTCRSERESRGVGPDSHFAHEERSLWVRRIDRQ